ncbi:MAG: Uma2 family endonuclease [Runella slithyformis]|nr:MAG: Uma2 family endonuclease [Runella slithyformis]
MVVETQTPALPRTLAEFQEWEPTDSFKYEWNDGEIITFTGMEKKQVFIYHTLLQLFVNKNYIKAGTLVAEYDIMLTGIQMRRPDIAYLSEAQIQQAKQGIDVIPEFVVEIISGNDNINKVEAKIAEYYKASVKVVWLILPEEKVVHIYTSRKQVQICTDDDICSAKPVLPDFEISVNALFA